MRFSICAARLLIGAWYLLAGIRWFVPGFPDLNVDSRWFVDALAASGLFTIVKCLEILFGVCLVTNRFVPAAIAGAMPISVVIAYNDLVLEHNMLFWCAGGLTLVTNVFLLTGYFNYFSPILTFRARAGGAALAQRPSADGPVQTAPWPA